MYFPNSRFMKIINPQKRTKKFYLLPMSTTTSQVNHRAQPENFKRFMEILIPIININKWDYGNTDEHESRLVDFNSKLIWHTYQGCRREQVRVIAAFLQLHHNIQQRHLVRPFGVQSFKVPCQNVFVVLPVKHMMKC